MKYYHRKDCRLCGSNDLVLSLKLTATPPADSYVKHEAVGVDQECIPLDLYCCNECGHTQLGCVIDAEEVYLNYIYETASTLGLDSHFRACAQTVMANYKPNRGGLVVDIGSNDGCLLNCFKELGMDVLGVDPMPGIAEKATDLGVETLPEFFTEGLARQIRKEYGAANIVTSNNLVADTDDLTSFVQNIRLLMDEDSIFFFETFYFYSQVKNNVWDFTYHEHYSYFTVKPLKQYFDKLGLQIIDIDPNDTKGGSMRVVLQLQGGKRVVKDSVQYWIDRETEEGFHTQHVFDEYKKRINKGKSEFLELRERFKREGSSIVGYGASATSTTLMYHYEMDGMYDYLVDDFEAKQGLFSPGMHFKVYPSSQIYVDKPDNIVILAWRYKDKIVERHQRYLEEKGTFIVPLPELVTLSPNK